MSLTKSEQARINGAKSRGPKTVEGKARSAANSTTHGLFARAVVLGVESTSDFDLFCRRYFETYQPQGEPEESLVEKIVCAVWRQHRLWEIEKVLLDMEMHELDPAAPLDVSPSALLLARAFGKGLSGSASLDKLYRMESSLDRMAARADRTLRLLQKNRQTPSPQKLGEPEEMADPPEMGDRKMGGPEKMGDIAGAFVDSSSPHASAAVSPIFSAEEWLKRSTEKDPAELK